MICHTSPYSIQRGPIRPCFVPPSPTLPNSAILCTALSCPLFYPTKPYSGQLDPAMLCRPSLFRHDLPHHLSIRRSYALLCSTQPDSAQHSHILHRLVTPLSIRHNPTPSCIVAPPVLSAAATLRFVPPCPTRHDHTLHRLVSPRSDSTRLRFTAILYPARHYSAVLPCSATHRSTLPLILPSSALHHLHTSAFIPSKRHFHTRTTK